jgi:iron complex transport system ATP-binding protein
MPIDMNILAYMHNLSIIHGIVREDGIAAVMTIHDLNQALRYADRFIFLKNGTIHFQGDDNSVTPRVIEEVYGLPVVMGTIEGIKCIMPGHCGVGMIPREN